MQYSTQAWRCHAKHEDKVQTLNDTRPHPTRNTHKLCSGAGASGPHSTCAHAWWQLLTEHPAPAKEMAANQQHYHSLRTSA